MGWLDGEISTSAPEEAASSAASGLSARLCYLALAGKLNVDLDEQEHLLRWEGGPVGKQLQARMEKMRADGWAFRRVDYIGHVAHNSGLETITYLAPEADLVPYALGVSVDHPAVTSATTLAHELGHHDGVGRWAIVEPGHEQDIMALRNVISEGRAMMTQAHVGQRLGCTDNRVGAIASAMARDDLGGHIFDVHYYRGFESIGRARASSEYSKYSAAVFGRDLVDKDGRIKVFDIDKGVGVKIGEMEDDAFHAGPKDQLFKTKMREKMFPGIAGRDFAPSFTETDLGMSVVRGGKVLGALGLFAAATDIRGAFERSFGCGFGRLAETGCQWGGYEGGALIANTLMRSGGVGARMAFVVAAGALGAVAADRVVGKSLAETLSNFKLDQATIPDTQKPANLVHP